jgi:hypothetical protein
VFFVPVGARGVFSLINETFSKQKERKKGESVMRRVHPA